LALKGKQPLEEVLSLTILVLIVLAIPIAPLYMLYERLMGGKSFMKLFRIVLTPKIGTGKRLTCESNLAEEHHSAGGFPQSIR
jgi:hypothetical protein